MITPHRQLTSTTLDDRAWKRYVRDRMRIFKLMHKIGNAVRKRKTADLRAARGKTKDRIFYKVVSDGRSVDIVQRSPAYGFRANVKIPSQPISALWLIRETAEDMEIVREIARQWFLPRRLREPKVQSDMRSEAKDAPASGRGGKRAAREAAEKAGYQWGMAHGANT